LFENRNLYPWHIKKIVDCYRLGIWCK